MASAIKSCLRIPLHANLRVPLCRQHLRCRTYLCYDEDGPSLAEKQAELNRLDPVLDKPINIGYTYKPTQSALRHKISVRLQNRRNPDMEKLARRKQLLVPLDQVEEHHQREFAPLHKHVLAEHYGIYRDMFDNASFVPGVQMNVAFDLDDDNVLPVYNGNMIPVAQLKSQPEVNWKTDEDSLWTLSMTSPDGHLQDNSSEVLHWLVANIPGNDISRGEELCNYLQPFPVKGTGWHRHVFVLYKQDGRIDMDGERRNLDKNLHERTFNTLEFYRQHQDEMTPAGLSWFQTEWDETITNFFRDELNMKEPSFEYDFPEPHRKPQKRWPHLESFQLYIDRYRDRKEIKEQVLKERLKTISPFEDEEQSFKYPNVYQMHPKTAQWIKTETMHRRNKRMKWKWLDPLQE